MSHRPPLRPVRVALTALGCKVNYAEMSDLAGQLAAAGLDVVADDEPADVRVLNSCTVTLQADATSRQRLGRLRRRDPDAHVVLTGCTVDGNPDAYLRTVDGRRVPPAGVDAVFTNAEKHLVADHVLRVAGARRSAGRAATPRSRARAFIKVQDGCDHRCTYCSVWRARGAAWSVPEAEVRAAVARAIASGHAEVVLCGVDLGSYGRDAGTTLAAMLGRLLDEIPDRARIRLSSINANDVSDALIELNGHPRLCSHWHLPLQSGSDPILRAMHRGYRRRQYLRVCAALRAVDPATELTTDVMVGFPGETDADHAATLDLIGATEMLDAHVFRHSPRPGTPAAALEGAVPDGVARRRSAEVRRVATISGRARRDAAIGRRHQVVWDRVDGGSAHGLSATYLEVRAAAGGLAGSGMIATVEATGVEGDVLVGRVVG